MERKDTANPKAGSLLDRAAGWLTDRRRFLAGAGKYGALLLGAKYAGEMVSARERARGGAQGGRGSQREAAPEPVDGQIPLAERNAVRVLGLAQRRPGLTRAEAPFADTPHIIEGYYSKVYTDMTNRPAGASRVVIVAVVTDGAFGGERNPQVGPYNLLEAVPTVQLPCTSLSNRDMVCECTYQVVAAGGRSVPRRYKPNVPRWVEVGTEMNIVVEQVFAHGTRPWPIDNTKAMHFIKFAPSVTDRLKTWQALHDRAIHEFAAFGEGLRGYELLQRVADMAPRQPNKCGNEMILPDVVAVYWRDDGVKNFPDYARAFRRVDTENAVDLWNTFFLLVEEHEAIV